MCATTSWKVNDKRSRFMEKGLSDFNYLNLRFVIGSSTTNNLSPITALTLIRARLFTYSVSRVGRGRSTPPPVFRPLFELEEIRGKSRECWRWWVGDLGPNIGLWGQVNVFEWPYDFSWNLLTKVERHRVSLVETYRTCGAFQDISTNRRHLHLSLFAHF